ncbi:MAG: universal stress protein [Rhodospirillales bacterium]|nr:universal stress protein [Rhodospirillales bacterium]
MSYKVLLAPMAGAPSDLRTLAAAAAVVRRFGGHVEALHAAGDPRDSIPFVGEGASGALVEQIVTAAEKDLKRRAETARTNYQEWMKGANVDATLVEPIGSEEDAIARHGRFADLIVLPRPADDEAIASTVAFETALLETGRPVLIAPPAGDMDFTRPVAFAWNGSREAARALGAGLPFMKGAPRVVCIVAGKNVAEDDTKPLEAYMARHGIKIELARADVPTIQAGPHVLAEARKAGCGLLVMGAYTHSRLRQLVFGGVTRFMLQNADLPVLMAH